MGRVVTSDSSSDGEDALSKESCPGCDTTRRLFGDMGDVINAFSGAGIALGEMKTLQ